MPANPLLQDWMERISIAESLGVLKDLTRLTPAERIPFSDLRPRLSPPLDTPPADQSDD